MFSWPKRAASAVVPILLAACGETAPDSTLDGIFTAEQAERGAGLYQTHCARCHSVNEFNGRLFATVWTGVPASALYLRIANPMPMDQPGSLGTSQVTALMAHIFDMNGLPSGSDPLGADLEWLTAVVIDLPEQ